MNVLGHAQANPENVVFLLVELLTTMLLRLPSSRISPCHHFLRSYDRFTASVDSSGTLLHRRGWRLEAGRAPLRETLAAGILALCKYDPALPLVDPMCVRAPSP
jgi:hypothetical protein